MERIFWDYFNQELTIDNKTYEPNGGCINVEFFDVVGKEIKSENLPSFIPINFLNAEIVREEKTGELGFKSPGKVTSSVFFFEKEATFTFVVFKREESEVELKNKTRLFKANLWDIYESAEIKESEFETHSVIFVKTGNKKEKLEDYLWEAVELQTVYEKYMNQVS